MQPSFTLIMDASGAFTCYQGHSEISRDIAVWCPTTVKLEFLTVDGRHWRETEPEVIEA